MKQPTQKQLAEGLGLSIPTVKKLIGQGMPRHSVEDAQRWRDTHQASSRRKPPPAATASRKRQAKNLADFSNFEEFASERMVVGSIEEVEEFIRALKQALQSCDEQINNLNQQGFIEDARKWLTLRNQIHVRYMPAHKELLRLRQEHKQLVSVPDAIGAFTSFLSRVRSQLDNMPASLCAKANPSDPDHARDILTEWRENVFKTLSQAEELKP